jgi:S-formylglutathione hydrolase FrmB
MAALAAPAGAGASRLVTLEAPSRYVDVKTADFGSKDPHPKKLHANVLLPDHYDPARRYPVLYLLHGAGEDYASWADPAEGDVKHTLSGLGAIVVMPDGGLGFYSNWWNDGRRAEPAWERYHLEELIPMIERRYRIRRERRYHAIAGFSMGGFGTSLYAELRPDYFGTAVPMSGFVSIERLTAELGYPIITSGDYVKTFGPYGSPYAQAHDPSKLATNLGNSRIMIYTGNGAPAPGVDSSPTSVIGGFVETELYVQNADLYRAARDAGAQASFHPHQGVHDWPYWVTDIRDAMQRGFFQKVDNRPGDWVYRTITTKGTAWDLRYRFDKPPAEIVRLVRSGDRLTATGDGSPRMAFRSDGGCRFSATVPFERRVPRHC